MPTVTGTFKDLAGDAVAAYSFEIIPTSGISVETNGDVTLPIRKRIITDDAGSFSTVLTSGNYELDVQGVTVKCTIPSTTDTVDLGDTDVVTNIGGGY